jgi:hypothetical protein
MVHGIVVEFRPVLLNSHDVEDKVRVDLIGTSRGSVYRSPHPVIGTLPEEHSAVVVDFIDRMGLSRGTRRRPGRRGRGSVHDDRTIGRRRGRPYLTGRLFTRA